LLDFGTVGHESCGWPCGKCGLCRNQKELGLTPILITIDCPIIFVSMRSVADADADADADSRQPTADSRQPTADSRQPTADSSFVCRWKLKVLNDLLTSTSPLKKRHHFAVCTKNRIQGYKGLKLRSAKWVFVRERT